MNKLDELLEIAERYVQEIKRETDNPGEFLTVVFHIMSTAQAISISEFLKD